MQSLDLDVIPRSYLSTFPNDNKTSSFSYYYKMIGEDFYVLQCKDIDRRSDTNRLVIALYKNLKLIQEWKFPIDRKIKACDNPNLPHVTGHRVVQIGQSIVVEISFQTKTKVFNPFTGAEIPHWFAETPEDKDPDGLFGKIQDNAEGDPEGDLVLTHEGTERTYRGELRQKILDIWNNTEVTYDIIRVNGHDYFAPIYLPRYDPYMKRSDYELYSDIYDLDDLKVSDKILFPRSVIDQTPVVYSSTGKYGFVAQDTDNGLLNDEMFCGVLDLTISK